MKKQTILTFSTLILCFGCSKNNGGDETGETGDTSGSNDYLVFESGDCHSEEELSAAPELSYVELSTTGDLWNAEPTVINSQQELDDLHAANDFEIDASGVDFSTQSVLFSQITIGSTCGTLPSVAHVVEIEGAPHLSLELTNPGGACETVCDMTAMAVKIVAVDKIDNHNATVCAREIATCDE